jgi:hypothetical protein
LNVELIGIGKDSHLSSLDNWISNNVSPIVADENPFNLWDDWDAGQRDMFVTDLDGNIVLQQNITSGIPDNLNELLIDLLSAGSPQLCELGDVYVSEAHTSGDPEDYIEIFNSSNEDCSIEGFQLDDSILLDDFTFGNVIITAGGFWIGYEDDDDSFTSGLSASGDSIVFADADGNHLIYILQPSEEFNGVSLSQNFSQDGSGCYSTPTPGYLNEECVALHVNDENNNIIKNFKLFDNFPNPFNPKTTFKYDIQITEHIIIDIIDIKGDLVKNMVNKTVEPGSYSVNWNAKDKNGSLVSSGVYFYKIKSNNHFEVKKMILMK